MTSPLDEIHACDPVRVAAMRATSPYCTPDVSVGGVAKTNVFVLDEPLEKPGMVAVARRPPAVMTGNPPLVVRTSRMTFGFVPEQPEQNIEASTFVSVAV